MGSSNNALVVLIAGSSTRFNHHTKKQFVLINDKPVFIHTLENLMKFSFERIIIVAKESDIETIKKHIANFNIAENIEYVEGGTERYYSVYNAMKYLKNNNAPKYVFIHDGVRPNIEKVEIENLYKTVIDYDAAILAIKMADTVKKVDEENRIVETVERTNLYRAATPQAFNFEKYFVAIEKYINESIEKKATDDAEIYSMYEGNVYVVTCSSRNIKITEKSDLDIV